MPLIERVGSVDRPVVFWVMGSKCAVDAAACPRRMGISVAAFPDHQHVVDTPVDEFDGGSRPSSPGTDHQH